MEIYSLYGHSGTGKSHHAPVLARKFNIDYIIDDGLLIKGNQIIAGRSAKRENTRFGAVKRALLNDPEHAQQIKDKINEIKPQRLLIIGTSKRMTEVITENLDLPGPSRYLKIEEISDSESIQTALAVREKENRHVIPLPTFAVKKDFPGYLINPLRSFFSLPSARSVSYPVERSVVRPVYSTLGSFFIAEHVIIDLVEFTASHIQGIHKVLHVDLENGKNRVILNIELAVDLINIPSLRIDLLLLKVQQAIKETIEYQTGFYLDQVNVYARKLHLDNDLAKDKLRYYMSSILTP